ncbi:MAG: iron-sulfur cluster assembly scaffold protein [Halobacteriota archaeon]
MNAFFKDILAILGGLPEDNLRCAALAADTLKAAIADYRAKKTALNLFIFQFH